ncbi:MAG TPA: formate dehydrogenase subunit gamma [Afifellaceae bacterium]|nr:formate dehydrogenase subunit gamma [Afifellaceae bacterium]
MIIVAVAFGLFIQPGLSLAQQGSGVDPKISAGAGDAPVGGRVPGDSLGSKSDADLWRAIKGGDRGNVSIPDAKAGVMVQQQGEAWRNIRNVTVPKFGAYVILGMIGLLALFFAVRGRLRISSGRAGITITRFTMLERAGHWLTASSFVILALTGLNILYGRSLLIPLIGKEAFAVIAEGGKYIHNYVAFAFIAGLVFIFVNWVANNIPNRHDIVWLAKGGGLLVPGVHPPARKFNAGQKIIFWLTILGGVSVSLSGWALLFPFSTSFMTHTFDLFHLVGLHPAEWFGLPEPPYSPMMEQQMNQVWHGIMALFLTAVIVAHIYIGTVGMEGGFDAMGSGEVDLNWAREHHNLWVEELEANLDREAEEGREAAQPAE